MTPNAAAQARRMWRSGFTQHNITAITGLSRPEVLEALKALDNRDLLKREAERLLSMKSLPVWYRGTPAEWRKLIVANYCDVLEPVA